MKPWLCILTLGHVISDFAEVEILAWMSTMKLPSTVLTTDSVANCTVRLYANSLVFAICLDV